MALTVVIAYDISEDQRRSQVAAVLQAWGDRVQRSVFVCTVDAGQLQTIREKITSMIDLNTDSIYVFRQCATCWGDIDVVGQATVHEAPLYWSIL